MFQGRRVFIVGGGPSLKGFDGACLRGRHVIGTNNAGLDIVPFCDILFFADYRWCLWNIDRLDCHTGPLKISRETPTAPAGHHVIHIMRHERAHRWGYSPWEVSGVCSGGNAINLAAHGGASEIILIGFDMHDIGDSNYHADHREPSEPGIRAKHFIPAIIAMVPHLRRLGVRVVNCTPGSALKCFEMGDLADYV